MDLLFFRFGCSNQHVVSDIFHVDSSINFIIVFRFLSWSRFNIGLIILLIIWEIVSQGLVRGQGHLKRHATVTQPPCICDAFLQIQGAIVNNKHRGSAGRSNRFSYPREDDAGQTSDSRTQGPRPNLQRHWHPCNVFELDPRTKQMQQMERTAHPRAEQSKAGKGGTSCWTIRSSERA